MAITAIIFDLYETLVTEYPSPPTRAGTLGPSLGLDAKAYKSEWKAMRPRILAGERTFTQALTEISQRLSGHADAAAIDRLREQRIKEKAAVFADPDPDVAAMIHGLKSRGIALAVISNGCVEDLQPWPSWPPSREFQAAVFSHAVGIAKPDPRIYLEAAEALGVDPAAALYIGDGAGDELAGAERAGLRAWRADWFTSRDPAHGPFAPARRHAATCADVLHMLATP